MVDKEYEDGSKALEILTNAWVKDRNEIFNSLNWLVIFTTNVERLWINWIGVWNKKKAIRSAKKLRKQLIKTQDALYEFMSNCL